MCLPKLFENIPAICFSVVVLLLLVTRDLHPNTVEFLTHALPLPGLSRKIEGPGVAGCERKSYPSNLKALSLLFQRELRLQEREKEMDELHSMSKVLPLTLTYLIFFSLFGFLFVDFFLVCRVTVYEQS